MNKTTQGRRRIVLNPIELIFLLNLICRSKKTLSIEKTADYLSNRTNVLGTKQSTEIYGFWFTDCNLIYWYWQEATWYCIIGIDTDPNAWGRNSLKDLRIAKEVTWRVVDGNGEWRQCCGSGTLWSSRIRNNFNESFFGRNSVYFLLIFLQNSPVHLWLHTKHISFENLQKCL